MLRTDMNGYEKLGLKKMLVNKQMNERMHVISKHTY